MRTLQVHSIGQDVLEAQCALTEKGFFSADIDGCFGPQVAAAVAQFQTSKQLPASGAIDGNTASALGLPDTGPTASALPQITPELVHATLFPQTPIDNIRANLPYILNALAEVHLNDRDMVGLALATLRTEAASFLPVSEQVCRLNTAPGGPPFGLYVQKLGNQSLADASQYRGRGFIQVTGRYNFAAYSKKIFQDDRLLVRPLLAHDRATASRVLARFLKDREQSLREALKQERLEQARALVNGGTNGQTTFEVAYTAALNLPGLQQLQLTQV